MEKTKFEDVLSEVLKTINSTSSALIRANTFYNTGLNETKPMSIEIRIVVVKEALKIFRNLNCEYSFLKLPSILFQLGKWYIQIKKYDKAITNFKEAIELEQNNSDERETIFLCNCYFELSKVYYLKNNIPQQSSRYFKKSYEIARKYGYTKNINIYNGLNLPNLYDLEMNTILIISYNHQLNKSVRKNKNKPNIHTAHFLYHLGILYNVVKKTKIALKYFAQALDMYTILDSFFFHRDILLTLHEIAKIYLEKKENEKAISIFEEAISSHLNVGTNIYNPEINQILASFILINTSYNDEIFTIHKKINFFLCMDIQNF